MRLGYLVVAAGVLVVLVTGLALVRARTNGMSTRSEPMAVERLVAGLARRAALPRRARDARNPVPFSDGAWAESREHFADHCASCHANDGSGDTSIGRNLYPRAPDMRLAGTQDLTDGELYWIIANGVRLTGMPAWGAGGDNDMDTWKLVHFIRRLNDLTPEQLEEMKALNPKTPSEREEEQQDDRFLAGADAAPAEQPAHHH
jgi:mono/diheme cytochrome c family protein